MKLFKTRVQAYEKALVFRHGALIKVLDPGLHWVGPFVTIMKYDVTELFYHDDFDLLLQSETLTEKIDLVEVSDQEIAIEYKNGNFNRVLTPGRYAYWKDGLEYLICMTKVAVSNSSSNLLASTKKSFCYAV